MAKPLAPMPGAAPDSASPANVSGAPSKNTILRPKAHNKDIDPAIQPIGHRTYAPRERHGAQYGIQVGFEAHQAPEAGLTQSNGRILPAAINRSAPNFAVGMQDHN